MYEPCSEKTIFKQKLTAFSTHSKVVIVETDTQVPPEV